MRTYEVAVKRPPIYGRDGAGTVRGYKVDGSNRRVALKKGILAFERECGSKDYKGYALIVTVVRVG